MRPCFHILKINIHLLICFYSGNKFTVEELFAMVLENAKQTAEAFAGK